MVRQGVQDRLSSRGLPKTLAKGRLFRAARRLWGLGCSARLWALSGICHKARESLSVDDLLVDGMTDSFGEFNLFEGTFTGGVHNYRTADTERAFGWLWHRAGVPARPL